MADDNERVVYRTGPGGAVEVLKSSRKITFVCTNCGCEFRMPQGFAPLCRNEMQKYIHRYCCPECGDECLSS